MSVCENDLAVYGKYLATASSEIEWRASVGRSYYAAYHRACIWHEKLPTHGIAGPNQGVHATLIQCLTNPTVTGKDAMRSKSIGYTLRVMKVLRQKADYSLAETVDKAEAETTAAHADVILKMTT